MKIDYDLVRKSLRAKGMPEDEIEAIIAKAQPKTKAKKVKEPLTPEEEAILKQRKEDDARSDEFKSRLVSAYHKKANGAGRRNPLVRLREIKHIASDPNVQGLSRFEGPALQSA